MSPEVFLFSCPCCGYHTLQEKPPGTFDICPVCEWEDDLVQFNDPDFSGGANTVSLREAQRAWLSSPGFIQVEGAMFFRDPEWKPR
jgi:hypothetical protein